MFILPVQGNKCVFNASKPTQKGCKLSNKENYPSSREKDGSSRLLPKSSLRMEISTRRSGMPQRKRTEWTTSSTLGWIGTATWEFSMRAHRPRMPLSAWTAIRREVESTGCPWAMKEIRYFQPSRTSELFWATGPVGVGSFPPVSCPIDLGHQG